MMPRWSARRQRGKCRHVHKAILALSIALYKVFLRVQDNSICEPPWTPPKVLKCILSDIVFTVDPKVSVSWLRRRKPLTSTSPAHQISTSGTSPFPSVILLPSIPWLLDSKMWSHKTMVGRLPGLFPSGLDINYIHVVARMFREKMTSYMDSGLILLIISMRTISWLTVIAIYSSLSIDISTS